MKPGAKSNLIGVMALLIGFAVAGILISAWTEPPDAPPMALANHHVHILEIPQ
jgi:hypothetical protein